jgi:hypothetical protein
MYVQAPALDEARVTSMGQIPTEGPHPAPLIRRAPFHR